SSNYNSNVLFGENNVLVVEADEYDRSFLTLHPNIAVVTSADADHLDIYGDRSHLIQSFELYLGRVVKGGTRIVKLGLPFTGDVSYSQGQADATVYAKNIKVVEGDFYFDYVSQETHIIDIKLGLPGLHNVENAVAAMTVALLLGVDQEKVIVALGNFKGVKRRF